MKILKGLQEKTGFIISNMYMFCETIFYINVIVSISAWMMRFRVCKIIKYFNRCGFLYFLVIVFHIE